MLSTLPGLVYGRIFSQPGLTLFTTNHLNGGRSLVRNLKTQSEVYSSASGLGLHLIPILVAFCFFPQGWFGPNDGIINERE